MPHLSSILSGDPVPAVYVALGFTICTIFVTAFVRSPRFRVLFGDMVMFFVRAVAFTVGWVFVAVVYLPIQLFNLYSPFVPYDNSKDEEEKNKIKKVDLSIYQVSDYDFSQRFAPVFDEDDQ